VGLLQLAGLLSAGHHDRVVPVVLGDLHPRSLAPLVLLRAVRQSLEAGRGPRAAGEPGGVALAQVAGR
jgi:hypothetical protein